MPFAAHQQNSTLGSKKLSEYQRKINNLPPSGGGGFHPALLGAANSGRMAGLSHDQIFDDLKTRATGKRRVPDREIRAAIEKAFTDLRPAADLPRDYTPPPRKTPPPPPQIDLAKLPATTEAELTARSPLRIPEARQQTAAFLQAVFRPDEQLFIGATTDHAQPGKNLFSCAEWLTRTPTGPFYVCNPLTGEEGTTSAGRPSYRAEACVADHRHLVFEMDGHNPATQASIIGWLVERAPVAAVYHSGGKSFHCLLRIDADDADHYRRLVDDARPFLKALGGDPATWHPSRLTRLPGASRPDKEGTPLQRLIYLNPTPAKDWQQFMDDLKTENAPPEEINAAVARLAALPPLEYEKIRKEEAKKIGIDRVGILDKAVAEARKKESASDELFPEDDPWPEPVDGRMLLQDITRTILKYSVLPPGSATTAALWVTVTYLSDLFQTLPILALISPEKRCGKTTLLTTLSKLAWRALPASNISPAAVFRSIEKFNPTLLIDEADTFLRDNDELRGVINSGHTRSTAFVIRCEGDNHEPTRFSTWCPKAIAMIKAPPDTILDRSIVVNLRRKLADEKTNPHTDHDNDCFLDLRRKILRFIADSQEKILFAKPDRLATENDRQADNWHPLIRVASVCGCEDEAREAAALSVGECCEDPSAGSQLLGDIAEIFASIGRDKISSFDLTKNLVELEDRPWSEWKHGKPMTPTTLGKLLKPFGIRSKTIRIGSESPKGFTLEMFKEALTCYAPPIQKVTRSQPNNFNKLSQFEKVTRGGHVTFLKQPNYPESFTCDRVTFSEGGVSDCMDENDPEYVPF